MKLVYYATWASWQVNSAFLIFLISTAALLGLVFFKQMDIKTYTICASQWVSLIFIVGSMLILPYLPNFFNPIPKGAKEE